MSRIIDTLRTEASRRVLADAIVVALAFAVSAVVFSQATRTTIRVGPATLVVHAQAHVTGETVVEIPPFGQVRARTHRAPLLLVSRVEEVDFAAARDVISEDALSKPIDDLAPGAEEIKGFTGALWRAALLGTAAAGGAAAFIVLVFRRRRATVMIAAVVAVVMAGGSLAATATTWDAAGFRQPTLTGGLTYLPGLADVFSFRVARIERLRTQAARVAQSLAAYYADDRSLASGGPLPDTYRVVHVSDLHLDSVGAELAAGIARSYEASLVIDTGDAPILGVDLESEMLASLLPTDVARVYVPGNHDSPASVEALSRLPGLTVLASGTVEVDGLRVLGVADPISRTFGVEPDREELDAVTDSAVARLQEGLRSGESTPDIVAIHNPAMERPFIGLADVILSGHTHSPRLYVSRGTVRLNSGTLGGMPYSPKESGRTALPHSASVLYYTSTLPRTLVAIDRIEVRSDRTTTVIRRLFGDESPD